MELRPVSASHWLPLVSFCILTALSVEHSNWITILIPLQVSLLCSTCVCDVMSKKKNVIVTSVVTVWSSDFTPVTGAEEIVDVLCCWLVSCCVLPVLCSPWCFENHPADVVS